jgi:hypothetical protein
LCGPVTFIQWLGSALMKLPEAILKQPHACPEGVRGKKVKMADESETPA